MYLTINQKERKKTSDEEKAALIKSIQGYKTTDETIAYLFADIDQTDITANDSVLHSAFHELKRKHPKLLEGLTFTCGQLFPFSIELQRAIYNMQKSDLMEAPNPGYDYHLIREKDKETIKSDMDGLFSAEEKAEISVMAKELKTFIEHGPVKANQCMG